MKAKITIEFDKKNPKMWSFKCTNCKYKEAIKAIKEMMKEVKSAE